MAQYGRTFEDRSHVFEVLKRPDSLYCKERVIHNLNVRGRRGNIVQVYPSVEYDFVPNKVELYEGDCIHFQWTGSDANNNGNAGNGRRMTDRSNLVEIAEPGKNVPIKYGFDDPTRQPKQTGMLSMTPLLSCCAILRMSSRCCWRAASRMGITRRGYPMPRQCRCSRCSSSTTVSSSSSGSSAR